MPCSLPPEEVGCAPAGSSVTSNAKTFLSLVLGAMLLASTPARSTPETHDGNAPRSPGIRQQDLLDTFRQWGDAAFERFRVYGEERLDSLRQSFQVIERSFSAQRATALIEAFKPGAKPSPELTKLDELMKKTRQRWSAIMAHMRENERGGMSRDAAWKKALRFAASADDSNVLYGQVVDQFAEGLMMDPEDLLNELARAERQPPRNDAERNRLLGLLVAQRFYLANGGADLSKKAHISQRAAILLLHGSKGSAEVKSTAKVLLAKLPELAPSERKDILEAISLAVRFGESTNRALYGDTDPSRLPGNKYGNALLLAHAVKVFSADPSRRSLLERGRDKTDRSTRDALLKVVEDLAEGPLPDAPRSNRVDPQSIAEGATHLRNNLERGLARVRERKASGAGPQGDRSLLDADRAFDDALDAVDDRRQTPDGRHNRDRSESDLLVGVPEWLCAVAVARASRGAEPTEALRRDCRKEFAEAGLDLPRSRGGNGGDFARGAGGIGDALDGSTGNTGGASGASSGGLSEGNGSGGGGALSTNRPATASDDATDADKLDGGARSLFARRDPAPSAPDAPVPAKPVAHRPPPAIPAAPVAPAAPALAAAPVDSPVAVASPLASPAAEPTPARAASSPLAANDHGATTRGKAEDHDAALPLPTVAGAADDGHGRRKGTPGGDGGDDEAGSRRGVAALPPRSSFGGNGFVNGGPTFGSGESGPPSAGVAANGNGTAASGGAFFGPTFWSSIGFTGFGSPVPSSSSSGNGDKKTPVGMLPSEANGWNPGMMPMPGTITMPRALYVPELGVNLLWRERNGFTPRAGEEAVRFGATDLRRSPLAAGLIDLPGTAPIALADLGPARETIFARKNDLLLGQAEFLLGKIGGKLPDGRKVEILRVAEIDPGVHEDDPRSLLGRTVKRRTIVKLVEKDGTVKTFTTSFDERYVPGPDGKPMAVKLAERIDVVEEAKGRAPIRRRIDRTFALDSRGRPINVVTNETLLGKDGKPIPVRVDKVTLDGGKERRRSTTFSDLDDWKKRVFELDEQISK